MNKLLGFGLLFAVLLLVSVSSVTVKKAFAIYFGNGPCPTGEARDYMGICFPIKECKYSLYARPGTCSVAPEAPTHEIPIGMGLLGFAPGVLLGFYKG